MDSTNLVQVGIVGGGGSVVVAVAWAIRYATRKIVTAGTKGIETFVGELTKMREAAVETRVASERMADAMKLIGDELRRITDRMTSVESALPPRRRRRRKA